MTTTYTSGGDELRARWACQRLAALGITAEPAYHPDHGWTGAVAIDPDHLLHALTELMTDLEWE